MKSKGGGERHSGQLEQRYGASKWEVRLDVAAHSYHPNTLEGQSRKNT